jgi:pyruvate dehydrogenase E2 component (dihydrolipoamide acetyltransferase)
MPKQGNTVEECILVSWRKKKGDQITEGEILADIETDKAVFELEAPAAGTLLETFFDAGDIVPVLINIGVIGEKGEDTGKFRPSDIPAAPPAGGAAAPPVKGPDPVQAPSVPSPVTGHPAAPQPAAAVPQAAPAEVFLGPRARKFAEKHPELATSLQGTGPGGRILETDVLQAATAGPRLSFLARQLIGEGYGMPAQGTGINGLVLGEDMLKPGVPLSNIRSVIASRMKASLTDMAQYTLNGSAEAVGLLQARKTVKAGKGSPGFVDINLNDMVMYCVIKALEAVPELNAEFIDGKIHRHDHVDIAFACDTPKGLMVPVIRKSETLSLKELARRLKILTQDAVEGRVAPDDLTGGSFTVSNLGIFGIESFTPIINAPQVAILGVCTIAPKPVRRNGNIEFVDHIGLSLTSDHQAVDGAPAARFMKLLMETISQFQL